MKDSKIRIVLILLIITSILTLIAALTGIFNNGIYKELLNGQTSSDFAVAGSVNQDLLAIPCSLALLVISILLFKKASYKLYIVSLGLVGYIFYGYAVYTFGPVVTPLYLIYIAIFALSVYCLILGILSFNRPELLKEIKLRKSIRNTIGLFLLIMTAVMSIKWISDIMLKSFNVTQPELYLIAGMDLGIVLPACGIIAIMILKNKAYGIILSGIALIKVFTLCLSVTVGTFIAPYFNLPVDYGTFYFFALLSAISLILSGTWYHTITHNSHN